MGWGFTVPFFPIVGFLGLIVGLGLRVQLWHVLGITVTVEFFTWVNEVFHRPGWPTRPCLQVLFCVFGCVVEAKYSKKSQVIRQQVHLCVYCDPPNQWYTVCDMKSIIVRWVDVLTSWAFLSANRVLEMLYLFGGKAIKLRVGAQLVSHEQNRIKWCHFASRLGSAVSMSKWKQFGNNFSAWKIQLFLVY